MKFGADPFAKNKFGINMHHVAAQGNEPAVMYFLLKEFDLSLLEKDDRGSTPLHWATYSKSEVALQYLLSWLSEDEINEPDNDGLTALHLSVKSVSSAENLRAVRALLIQGANRAAQDVKGKTALDLVSELKNERLEAQLKDLLKEPSKYGCLLLKTPLKRINRSSTLSTFCSALVLTSYFFLFFCVLPGFKFMLFQ